MENIDLVYLLEPVVVLGFTLALVLYWHLRRRLTLWTLVISFVAYFGAIATKEVIQVATYGPLNSAVSGNPWVLGPYFGLQTVFLEVGFAYLFARYAVKRAYIYRNDAEGYGISLGLWENGVLIAGLSLIDYLAYYYVLSGSGTLAQHLFSILNTDAPSLFYPAAKALPLVGYGILERVSSALLHFSWGYLCVLAAAFKKKRFLAVALPMGLVDFFVPFESDFGLGVFEAFVFVIALASVAIALGISRGEHRQASVDFKPHPEEVNPTGGSSSQHHP